MISWILLGFYFGAHSVCWGQPTQGPQNVRLAATTEASQMVVQWSSQNACANPNDAFVVFGQTPDTLNRSAEGNCTMFTLGNPKGMQHTHTVQIEGLKERTKYFYAVVAKSDLIRSEVFFFTTLSSDPLFVPNVLYFGDLGHRGGDIAHKLFTALPAMVEEVRHGDSNGLPIDLIIHAGDFGYDLDSDGGLNGDVFQRNVQSLSAFVPYMTVVGNHEHNYEFSHYRHRFHMPRSELNDGFDMWYSLDVGAMHLVFFSTETLFYWPKGNAPQLEWLRRDLEKANANRAQRPWIVSIGHRPIYCSNADRDCVPWAQSAGLRVQQYTEALFFAQGVDVQLWAHEHSYERTFPVYNGTVTQKDYCDPRAPVHLISGAAGCNEALGVCVNPILRKMGEWSAFRTEGIFHPYSYGHFRALNATHFCWDQVNAQKKQTFDQICIKQTTHGPFEPLQP